MEKYIITWVIMIITYQSPILDLDGMRNCNYNVDCDIQDTTYITKYVEIDSLDNAIYFYDKMRLLQKKDEMLNELFYDSIPNCPKVIIAKVWHNDFGFIYEQTGK